MAGDWIKVESATPDKPEVIKMATILNIDQDSVFGKCFRVWAWADQHTITGNDVTVTDCFLDRLTNCPGFAAALRKVGWINGRNATAVDFPNFSRHNGQTAKNRALANERQRKNRSESRNCHAASVTEPLPEKRREEKRTSLDPSASPPSPPIDSGGISVNQKRLLTDLWKLRFQETFGQPYAFQGAKDGQAADRLLKIGLSVDDLLAVAKAAWAKPDGFNSKHAVSLASFESRFNHIRAELGILNARPGPSTQEDHDKSWK